MAAQDILPMLEAEAKQRQANSNDYRRDNGNTDVSVPQNFAEPIGEARDESLATTEKYLALTDEERRQAHERYGVVDNMLTQ